jgi:HEAT repeat protein
MERYGDWTYRGKPLRRWARMFRGGTGDREEAAPALMAAGKPAVPFLVDLMGARRSETRAAAARALATMARGRRHGDATVLNPCPEALEALLAAVEDPDPRIRLHAIAVLDEQPVDEGRATPALRRAAAHDPGALAREAAQRALARREAP